MESAAKHKGGEFRNYPLDKIANALVKPHGIKAKMHNPPKGAEEPFDVIRLHHGETIFEALSRLARMRDCFFWSEADGTIKLGLPDGDGASGAQLEEGLNILAANCSIVDPASKVTGHGQDAGTDDHYGSRVSQLGAVAEFTGATNKREHIFLAEEPATKREMQLRVNHEMRALLAMAMQVTITHRGWLKPGGPSTGAGGAAASGLPGGNAAMWNLGETVDLKSPMIIPVGDGRITLRVAEIVWGQSNEVGTTTTVTLVNDAVFSQMGGGDARKNDPAFDPGASEARPGSDT